jgi:hypothetical protein
LVERTDAVSQRGAADRHRALALPASCADRLIFLLGSKAGTSTSPSSASRA